MNLLKTSFLSGIATIIKILSGLIVNKVISIMIGPSGLAIIGNFQNLLSILTTLGTGAINSGVTKYTAEYYNDHQKRKELIGTAFVVTIVCSLLTGIIFCFVGEEVFHQIFKTSNYDFIIFVLGGTLIFNSVNLLILSILNGYKQIKIYILANIVGSIASLILTTAFTFFFGMVGALLSLVLVPSFVLIFTLYISWKYKVEVNTIFSIAFNKKILKNLLQYSLMAITSILAVSIVQILIRTYLSNKISIDAAGYWQAITKISDIYLMVVTMALSTYYLPRLSEINSNEELRKELIKGYKLIIPIVILASGLIFLLKDFIIDILFSSEFRPMRKLFLYQLVGDNFKILSWLLGYIMLAKSMTKLYIITEIGFGLVYYLLTIIFVHYMGMTGATLSFAISYIIYFLLMIYIFRKILFLKSNQLPID
ncbi:O-antigen translocase [Geobacillus stearothermophilus]|uniref:O-antigen translocase n=1 Tax=Geobacillus stearothermophilus TaxID=1422 RepID=UPI000EF5D59E|nr:O-antigen translocase [Geobacillus stearothermophilus]RLP97558.1 O-antigen translocase [Geobacillus stearothermophilus]